ncbi:MAG: GNAT family N-acetyltransferase [Lentimicrobiaceae bacterium]|nr:GNAT family N-acetyltransferase [Lentimicrobiaceae bacterium]
MAQQITIPLSKSTLRPFTLQDARSLALHANNLKIARNLRDAFPHPYNLEDAEKWIETTKYESDNLMLAIEIGGEVVGAVGMHRFKDVYRLKAEIGYWLSEKYWGKGIVTEALSAFVRHIFSTTDLIRIQAEIFEHNKASMRVLEKAGFACEAIHRKAVIKNGKILDEYIYVIFRQ